MGICPRRPPWAGAERRGVLIVDETRAVALPMGAGLSRSLTGGIRAALHRGVCRQGNWRLEAASGAGDPGVSGRRVLKAVNPETGHAVTVKIHGSRLRCLSEFLAMRRLHRLTRACVAPLMIARDARFVVSEWIDAPLVSDLYPTSARAAALQDVGAWLRRLHAQARRGKPRLTATYRLRIAAPDSEGEVAQAVARLTEREERVTQSSSAVTMLHGDCHGGNFFAEGRRLLAFDRERDLFGIGFIDVAKFLIDLELRRDRAARAGRPWDGDADEDRRSFFAGYGPVAPEDLALFDFIEDAMAFRLWKAAADRLHVLQRAMRGRALLDGDGATMRPGRLVGPSPNACAWTRDV